MSFKFTTPALRNDIAEEIAKDYIKNQNERVRINVGGRVFETYTSTLRKYPNTLLGTMFHPRNRELLKQSEDTKEDIFFDRNPRAFEAILDFYRTGRLIKPDNVPLALLKEELKFFQLDPDEEFSRNKRISMELMKLDYTSKISSAAEYKKITRLKLLSEHHRVLEKILDILSKRIYKRSKNGHNSSTVTFFSPLHYTDSTPREVFNVMSINEIRGIIVELFKDKGFEIEESNEYSKAKTTDIIGLKDEITNYNDPKYFTFLIKW